MVKLYSADGTAGAALWKSRLLPGHGQLAQSVEQRTENPRVPGSIPGLATKNVLDNSKTFFLALFFIKIIINLPINSFFAY